ncbi:MAG: hypothetical protein J7M24_03255 [Candidatus Latescibacteria bacterium]|nr:hypothetical protein [Candidatus Latescibacterota bacterium]
MLKQIVHFLACIALMTFVSDTVSAQEDSPVKIAFDSKAERKDIVTGEQVPDYGMARRGSLQFFIGRLDEPDDFVTFFHDGIRTVKVAGLKSMEKVQEKFAVWRLRYKSGGKNTPRIHDLAVSFVPLSGKDRKPERRVFVLLKELTLIDWGGGPD